MGKDREHGNLENKRRFHHRVCHDKRNLILQELVLVENQLLLIRR